MAPNNDLVLERLFTALDGIAKTYKPTYDDDVRKCLVALNSKMSDLICQTDSPNSLEEFSTAKREILANMKKLYKEMEKQWIDNMAMMTAGSIQCIEEFLKKTKMGVKMPLMNLPPCFGAISDSPNSVLPYSQGSTSQDRLMQESTQTSNMMPISFQNTSELLRPIEDIQPQVSANPLNCPEQQVPCTNSIEPISQTSVQAPTNQVISHTTTNTNTTFQSLSLNNSGQQVPCTSSTETTSPTSVQAPTNQVISHSTTNTSNESPSPSTSNQVVNNWSPNGTIQSPISASSIMPVTYSTPKKSPKKEFNCPYCDAKFLYISHLKRHLPKHTKVKDFPCKFCGRKFPHQGAHSTHEKQTCKKRKLS